MQATDCRSLMSSLTRVLAATMLSLTVIVSATLQPGVVLAQTTAPPAFPPYPLAGPLGNHYNATDAQNGSFARLQQAAVGVVLKDHGLPSSDASAVQTWARDESVGALWGLIVQAIQSAPSARTTDQQNVVDWLGNVVK